MISSVKHFNPLSALAAMVHDGRQVHLCVVVSVEARTLDGSRMEYHPVAIAPSGELKSLEDWRRECPALRYRLDLQQRWACEDYRREVEDELSRAAADDAGTPLVRREG